VNSSLPSLAAFLAASHGHALMRFFFRFGYIGLFFVSIVDSSFVPLPIPGVTDIMLIIYAANHGNTFLLVGLAKAGGMHFLEKHVPKAILTRVTAWMDHHPILSVALPAVLPPPMPLSPFVLAAGAAHMSRKKFMIAFTISRFVRHSLAVWIGIRYGRDVLHLWNNFSTKWATTILIAFWVIIVIFTAIAIWRLVKTSKEMQLEPAKKLHHAARRAVKRRHA
jgi:membrane protein YqaA with SNARE-associated domain